MGIIMITPLETAGAYLGITWMYNMTFKVTKENMFLANILTLFK